MRNGGAAHKNIEAPRRFEISGFLVSHPNPQLLVTSHQSLKTPNPCPLIPAFKLPVFLHLYIKILFYYTEK